MSDNETCHICAVLEQDNLPGLGLEALTSTVSPDANIGLCCQHWLQWIAAFLNTDISAPCSAHVIEAEVAR